MDSARARRRSEARAARRKTVGPTQPHAIIHFCTAAIDKGTNINGLAMDQRDLGGRGFCFARDSRPKWTIGAYEVQAAKVIGGAATAPAKRLDRYSKNGSFDSPSLVRAQPRRLSR